MPRVICAFLKQHEQANISLVVQSSTEVVDQVVGQRCDLGLIAEPYAFPGPRGERLLRSPLVCALPAGHRLQAKALLVPADLEGGTVSEVAWMTIGGKRFAVFHGVAIHPART
jgi:DNA-binding transcriptional LysR family regulator